MELLKKRLKAVRDAKRPWFEIAVVMAEAIGPEPRDERVGAVVSAARDATLLSPQILKRYLALLDRTRKIAEKMGVPASDLLSPQFNALEVAVRIYAKSEDEGADVLRRLAQGELSLPRVRELQTNLASQDGRYSPNTAARHRRTVNAGIVETALTRAGPQLWGAGSSVERRPMLSIVGGWPGHEVIGADGSIAAGVDTLFPDSDRIMFETKLGGSLLLAPFFPAFYLAMPPDADEGLAAKLEEVLDWFGYSWVGVLSVTGEDNLSVTREPVGRPEPDRTMKYESLKRKYQLKRSAK